MSRPCGHERFTLCCPVCLEIWAKEVAAWLNTPDPRDVIIESRVNGNGCVYYQRCLRCSRFSSACYNGDGSRVEQSVHYVCCCPALQRLPAAFPAQ